MEKMGGMEDGRKGKIVEIGNELVAMTIAQGEG